MGTWWSVLRRRKQKDEQEGPEWGNGGREGLREGEREERNAQGQATGPTCRIRWTSFAQQCTVPSSNDATGASLKQLRRELECDATRRDASRALQRTSHDMFDDYLGPLRYTSFEKLEPSYMPTSRTGKGDAMCGDCVEGEFQNAQVMT